MLSRKHFRILKFTTFSTIKIFLLIFNSRETRPLRAICQIRRSENKNTHSLARMYKETMYQDCNFHSATRPNCFNFATTHADSSIMFIIICICERANVRVVFMHLPAYMPSCVLSRTSISRPNFVLKTMCITSIE
jgi:hypothetical protein